MGELRSELHAQLEGDSILINNSRQLCYFAPQQTRFVEIVSSYLITCGAHTQRLHTFSVSSARRIRV